MQILGWGRDKEAWVIDYRVLWGDPSGPRLWSDLDMVLQATFPHLAGIDLPVCAAALDTFVYAHAALHGLIIMGLRLNEEVEGVATVSARPNVGTGCVVRSAWMG